MSSGKREENESFEDYRKRMKKKAPLMLRIFYMGEVPYRRKPKDLVIREPLVSPAIGKRHRGEDLGGFKKRRKLCNKKRREKEHGIHTKEYTS